MSRAVERAYELDAAARDRSDVLRWRMSADVHDELMAWHVAQMRKAFPDFPGDDSPLLIVLAHRVTVDDQLPRNSLLLEALA